MKLFVLFISIAVSTYAAAQAKQLNELLKRYAYTLEWNRQQPIALQDSKELVVPGPINTDTLWVIKWKDIDSVKIAGTRRGSVNVVLYGKAIKYRKVENADTCAVKYFKMLYCKEGLTGQVRLFLGSKNEGEKLAQSGRLRKKIRKAFHQLNNAPVIENYGHYYEPPSVGYDRKTKALIYYFNNPGKTVLKASDFRNAEKIVIGFSPKNPPVVYKAETNEIIFYPYGSEEKLVLKAKDLQHAKRIAIGIDNVKIASFDLVITGSGTDTTISNRGSVFNDEIIKILATVQQGAVLVFKAIHIENEMYENTNSLSIALIAK